MFVASSHLFVFVVFDRVSNNTTFISEHYLVPTLDLRLLLAFFIDLGIVSWQGYFFPRNVIVGWSSFGRKQTYSARNNSSLHSLPFYSSNMFRLLHVGIHKSKANGLSVFFMIAKIRYTIECRKPLIYSPSEYLRVD